MVLNACYSETQARAIAEHIDAVVGMTTAVGDQAAINFAAAFYQALGFGRTVKNGNAQQKDAARNELLATRASLFDLRKQLQDEASTTSDTGRLRWLNDQVRRLDAVDDDATAQLVGRNQRFRLWCCARRSSD